MTNWRDFCLKSASDYADEFKALSESTEPQHSAILPSEMLLFCAVAKALGIDAVVESGRKLGYSTEIIARCGFEDFTSLDVDPAKEADDALLQRLGVAGRVKLEKLDAMMFLRAVTEQGDAILLDGPKGRKALGLVSNLLGQSGMMAVHDLNVSMKDERATAAEMGAFFSDDEEFLSEHGHLDETMLTYRGYGDHGELISVANVLAVFRGGYNGRDGDGNSRSWWSCDVFAPGDICKS